MNVPSRLDNLYIATPCNAKWEDMVGDDKVRACSLCSKNVFNISNMTRLEAERLLTENGSSICVGIYRRKDGTILIDDCPFGLRQIRNGWNLIRKSIAALLGLLLSSNMLGENAAQAAEGFRSRLIAQGARFGASVNTWGSVESRKKLKQMEQSNSIEAAVYHSSLIVEAQFVHLEQAGPISYQSRPLANYRVTKTLKGVYAGSEISIRYSFHDRFALEEPADWRFSEDKLPKAGERFILFLERSGESAPWDTYNGSFGRFKSNAMNLAAVSTAISRLSKSPPRNTRYPKSSK